MVEKEQYIQGLDEYIRQSEPQKQERGRAWQTAIGLQEQPFNFSPIQYTSIRHRLFEGIYKFGGRICDYNITKQEWVLRGETVYYASADTISETLDYDMGQERNYSYEGKSIDEVISHLARFCANLWQIHAFGEENTRTTAVFMIKYLKTLGFKVTNDLFATNSWYFRNALVRANYSNLQEGVTETTVFLERFFRNMLLGETSPLRNREMHLDWKQETESRSSGNTSKSAKPAIQSANSAQELPPKCNFCTLEEVAVLRVIQQNPSATQKYIAFEIGKSERTVKSTTARLAEQGFLKRVNGKRNGYWEIVNGK